MDMRIDEGFALAASAQSFENLGDLQAAQELWHQAATELLGVAEELGEEDPRRELIICHCGPLIERVRALGQQSTSGSRPAQPPAPAPAVGASPSWDAGPSGFPVVPSFPGPAGPAGPADPALPEPPIAEPEPGPPADDDPLMRSIMDGTFEEDLDDDDDELFADMEVVPAAGASGAPASAPAPSAPTESSDELLPGPSAPTESLGLPALPGSPGPGRPPDPSPFPAPDAAVSAPPSAPSRPADVGAHAPPGALSPLPSRSPPGSAGPAGAPLGRSRSREEQAQLREQVAALQRQLEDARRSTHLPHPRARDDGAKRVRAEGAPTAAASASAHAHGDDDDPMTVCLPRSLPAAAASEVESTVLWLAADDVSDASAVLVRAPPPSGAVLVRAPPGLPSTEGLGLAGQALHAWVVPGASGSAAAARLRTLGRANEARDEQLRRVVGVMVVGPRSPERPAAGACLLVPPPHPDALTMRQWLSREGAPSHASASSSSSSSGASAASAAARAAAGVPTACGRSAADVRAVFAQLLQALARLHAVGLPGCLHADTVTVRPAAAPGGCPTVALLPVAAGTGAHDACAAPEAAAAAADPAAAHSSLGPCLGGGLASRPADVFLAAGWLLEAVSGRSPLVLPGSPGVAVPASFPSLSASDSAALAALLRPCLLADPSRRPSAADACRHPWFLRAREADLVSSGAVASRSAKSAMLRTVVRSLRAQAEGSPRIKITLARSNACSQLLEQVASLPASSLGRMFRVEFTDAGETGIDAGGLLSEAYSIAFARLCSTDGAAKCGLGYPMFVCSAEATEPLFLPASDEEAAAAGRPGTGAELSSKERRRYEAVGRLLSRCVLDERPVPARFAPTLWKHVLGLPPTLSDLRSFDPVVARGLDAMVEMPPHEVEAACFDFDGLRPGGADVLVTGDNVAAFADEKAAHTLVGSRQQRLDAIRRGFHDCQVASALAVLSYGELVAAVCGTQDVTGAMVNARLRFAGFRSGSKIPSRFRQAVRGLTPEQASGFLLYTTALSALPPSGGFIKVSRMAASGLLPVAHTCFARLDVCDDDADAAEVARRLAVAIANVADAGFGIA